MAPCVGSRPPARAQDLPQSKLISTEENSGRTWAGTENHDTHIGSIWLSLSQSLLSTFLVWIRNDVWPNTTHAMALYRRAGLPALAAWEAQTPKATRDGSCWPPGLTEIDNDGPIMTIYIYIYSDR